jgi:VIT1/CCC1 family predicted Fe2+/Mn2+ transporter
VAVWGGKSEQRVPGRSLIHRYLAPDESLSEVLFGLIMALTITAGARLFAEGGQFDVHRLVVATVGCNVAWGVIDAVLYALGGLFRRSRRARFHRTLLSTRDQTDALAALEAEFTLQEEPLLQIRPDDRARLYESLLALSTHAATARPRLRRRDFVASFVVFVLVSASALPGVIPLLVFEDADLALHVSNWLLILLLFIVGYAWGHYTEARPWRAGLIVLLLGVCMVLIVVVLGG